MSTAQILAHRLAPGVCSAPKAEWQVLLKQLLKQEARTRAVMVVCSFLWPFWWDLVTVQTLHCNLEIHQAMMQCRAKLTCGIQCSLITVSSCNISS